MRKLGLIVTALLLLTAPAASQVGGGVTFVPPVTVNHCVKWLAYNIIQDAGAACGTGAGSVTSISNSDGTITLSPSPITTTGTVSLALGHANTWSGVQSFTDGDLSLLGSGSGNSIIKAPATGGGTATLPAGSGTLVYAAGAVTSIAGTANEITASASTGAVTLSLPTALTFTGKTVTGGTFSGITLAGTIPGTPTYSGAATWTSTTANIFEALTGNVTRFNVISHAATDTTIILLGACVDVSSCNSGVGAEYRLQKGSTVIAEIGDDGGINNSSSNDYTIQPKTGLGTNLQCNASASCGIRIDSTGLFSKGSAPGVSGTGSPAITSGSTDTAGEVTSGASATSVVITFTATKTNAPFCIVSPQTQLLAFAYTISTSAITITQTATSGEKIDYYCSQH